MGNMNEKMEKKISLKTNFLQLQPIKGDENFGDFILQEKDDTKEHFALFIIYYYSYEQYFELPSVSGTRSRSARLDLEVPVHQ